MKKKSILLLAGFALSSFWCFGQSPPYTLPVDPINYNSAPAAPESWAFTKYGDYQVSRETGIPNISIPLYTARDGRLSVPVNLSYHAAGIKVDDTPSWVGTGWDLNVGGVVTRTVKGHPDERMEGYLNTGIPELSSLDLFTEWEYAQRLMAGEADAEPDEFAINAPGLSGKFYFKEDGQVISHPFGDDSVSYTLDGYDITSFTIIRSDGVKYLFGSPSMTSYITNYNHYSIHANTTWYLLEMQSPTGEKVKFFYKTKASQTSPRKTQTDYVTLKSSAQGYLGYFKQRKEGLTQPTYIDAKVVERIEFKTGKVVFNSSQGRVDESAELKLNSVEIYGADYTTVIKAFDFSYDYFVSAQSATPDKHRYRLKLLSVGERTLNNVSAPPYTFTYHEHLSAPPRFSFSQDYWGYANGQTPNGSLLPLYTFKDPQGVNIQIGNANREPNESSMKLCTIKRITYPTQGYTEFDFEANRVRNSYTKVTLDTPTFSAKILPILPSESADYAYFPAENVAMPANKTAYVTYSIEQVGDDILPDGMMFVGVEDITAGTSIWAHSAKTEFNQTKILYLTAGHEYRLYVHSYIDQINIKGYAKISLYWENTSTQNVTENTMVGGLRVSSMKHYDDNGVLQSEKFFNYELPDNSGYSSGIYNAVYMPSPEAFLNSRVMRYNVTETDCMLYTDNVISLTASPSNTKAFPLGNLVTYEYVTELNANPTNNTYGKSIYRYDIQKNSTVSQIVGTKENSWSLDKSWLRGQLRKESHLNQQGDTVKNVSYQYEIVDVSPVIIASKFYERWQIGNNNTCVTCGAQGSDCPDAEVESQRIQRLQSANYEIKFQWKRLKSITTTQDGVTSTVSLAYNPQNKHSNVIYAEETTSDNRQVKTYIRYPHEVNETELLARNIVSVPVESDVYIGTTLQSGNRITYGQVGSRYIPRSFEQRLTDGSSYLQIGEVTEADLYGNPIIIKKRDGIDQYILWNAQGNLPLAQVVGPGVSLSNVVVDPTYSSAAPGTTTLREFVVTHGQRVAVSTTILDPSGAINGSTTYSFYVARTGESTKLYEHNQVGSKSDSIDLPPGRYQLRADLNAATSKNIVTQVEVNFKSIDAFYQGFEETEGNSSLYDARTGTRSRTGNYQIKLSNLTDGKPYILSYFKKENGVWTLYNSNVSSTYGEYTIDLTGQVDEVRFHPKGTQMSTYAYDPLNASLVRTMTDANSRSAFYEYDPHGRLEVVRDDNFKINKTLEYRYKTGQN